MNWMPLAPCAPCNGGGSIAGIGGMHIACEQCEGSGGGGHWISAAQGIVLLLHRSGAAWRGKLVLGPGMEFSSRFGGRSRRVRTTGTRIAALGTWGTLADAQAGAELAARLLVVRARCPAAAVGTRK